MFTTSLLLVGGIVELVFKLNNSIIRVVIIAINRTDTFVQGLIGTGCVIIGLGIFRGSEETVTKILNIRKTMVITVDWSGTTETITVKVITSGITIINTCRFMHSLSLCLDHEGLYSCWQQLYQGRALYH